MRNLLIKNLNIPNRTLVTSCQQCKHISPYDNPVPRDEDANNVFRKQKWQKVHFKAKQRDKYIEHLKTNDNYVSNPIKAKYLSDSKMRSFYDQIQAKGFARELKPYRPPADLKEKFDKICLELFGQVANEKVLQFELNDPVIKYKLIVKCIQEFDNELPNSDLHLMKNVNNVLSFFATPVKGVNTFDSLATSSKIPKNLHLVTDSVKFNPDTDTFFDGLDAFPKRAIIDDGIKTKKKYDNFKTQIYWPDI